MSSSQSTDPIPTAEGGASAAAETPAEKASKKKAVAQKGSRSSKKKGGAPPTDPFERLERQVHLAIQEIERLRRVNAELRSEVADLAAVARRKEEELREEEPASTSSEAASWETERGEIRERVEGLVSGLEQMLILVEEE